MALRRPTKYMCVLYNILFMFVCLCIFLFFFSFIDLIKNVKYVAFMYYNILDMFQRNRIFPKQTRSMSRVHNTKTKCTTRARYYQYPFLVRVILCTESVLNIYYPILWDHVKHVCVSNAVKKAV